MLFNVSYEILRALVEASQAPAPVMPTIPVDPACDAFAGQLTTISSHSQRLLTWLQLDLASLVAIYAHNAFLFELSGVGPCIEALIIQGVYNFYDPYLYLLSLAQLSLGYTLCADLSPAPLGSLAVNTIAQVVTIGVLSSTLGPYAFTLDLLSWPWWLVKASGCFVGGSFLLIYGP